MILQRRRRRSYVIASLLVIVAALLLVAVTVQGALTPVRKSKVVHNTDNQPYTVVRQARRLEKEDAANERGQQGEGRQAIPVGGARPPDPDTCCPLPCFRLLSRSFKESPGRAW